jgi:chromosome segregation protein
MAQAVNQRAATHERLAGEFAEIAQQLVARAEAGDEAQAELAQLEAAAETHAAELERTRQDAEGAADALASARGEAQAAELALQESSFAVRSAEQQAANLRQQIAMAEDSLVKSLAEQERLQHELAQLSDEEARMQLEQCLQERLAAEQALSDARGKADELSGALRRLDEERLRLERGQEPLRSQLTELKLKEQAARLTAEQMGQSLVESAADEADLAQRLAQQPSRPKPGWLQSEVGRLNQAIARLGPVNLAALDEVVAARERQAFLASQSADLFEAMTTLENAIRTIDQESRALLQQTYDTVNTEFGRLFPMLFGGGDARLVLTGGEILDAGVQVVAQPPGKKNASIHLLSGGEKALTAIALVFAIFKLNPAPFCLLDEVDAPLDDANTERYSRMVKSMAGETQFLFITHNKIAMEMAEQLIGVTMQERGVSRLVAVDLMSAAKMAEAA